MDMTVATPVSQAPKILPKKGDTVALLHRSTGDNSKPRLEREKPVEVSTVTAVYLDPFTVKVTSGEVWQVKACGNSTAKWETVK